MESYTQEKVCFPAGPEFGPLASHTLVIVKALYGLHSSGLRFHEKLADSLRAMGFFPSYADPDVWMCAPPDPFAPYDYIIVYVDDLFVAMKDPLAFFQELQTDPWNYKLKGVGPPCYHLGADFFRNSDSTLCMGTQTYAKRLLSNFEKLFGTLPVIDIHYTLHMFGVPLDGPAWLLGDNQAVINSTTIPHSSLSKRWNALSYHCCREAVAAGIVHFEFLPGRENPSDILTKNLPWAKACVFVEPLLLWKGETVSSGTPNQRGVTG